jgi:hypothetical protein
MTRRLHKAFLRYHDPNNWPLLREALKAMGRADLIGNGKHHLIPTFQPATDGSYQSARRKNSTPAPGQAAARAGARGYLPLKGHMPATTLCWRQHRGGGRHSRRRRCPLAGWAPAARLAGLTDGDRPPRRRRGEPRGSG